MGGEADGAQGPSAADARRVPTAQLSADIRVAVARIYSRFRSERAPGEVGDAALFALTLLQKHGPLALTELSDRARVTPGSMSQTVNRLTADGYAFRQRDAADGRRVLFDLTSDGAALAAASRDHRQGWLSSRLDDLNDHQRDILAEAAQILRDIADS